MDNDFNGFEYFLEAIYNIIEPQVSDFYEGNFCYYLDDCELYELTLEFKLFDYFDFEKIERELDDISVIEAVRNVIHDNSNIFADLEDINLSLEKSDKCYILKVNLTYTES